MYLDVTLPDDAADMRLDKWLDKHMESIKTADVADKTKENKLAVVRTVQAMLGSIKLQDLKPFMILRMLAAVKTTPHKAKRMLTELRNALDSAMEYGCIDENLAANVRMPSAPIHRSRLSIAQWQAMHAWAVKHSPPWVGHMLRLAVLTGQRRSDLKKMKFTDVWDGYLHVVQKKTGARVAIPTYLTLPEVGCTTQEAIDACRYGWVGEHILHKSDGGALCGASMSWRFAQAREGASCVFNKGPASLHECRALAASRYELQGKNVQKLLGHSSASMTAVYLNLRGATTSDWKEVE